MLESIVSYGLAVGAVYALIGITYNLMFTASRVFSFTAGMLGMLGGVLGALFITKLGLPTVVAFVLVLACGAAIGVVTEIVAVRPVLKSLEQHLYVLSTLAFALMVQQLTAIEWGTDAQPFPRLIPIGPGWLDQQFWLPLLACAVTIVGLELLYRHTLIGRAFLAIAEDSYAARALGLPEQRLRMASYALAGVIGALAGFTGAEMLLAFFGNQAILNFYGFVPVALGDHAEVGIVEKRQADAGHGQGCPGKHGLDSGESTGGGRANRYGRGARVHHTRRAVAAPASPSGRSSRTTMKTTNTATAAKMPPTRKFAACWNRPSASPPITAPRLEPMPPNATGTKP